MSSLARINCKQRVLIWFAVGLFALWLMRSCYLELAKLSGASLADPSALSIALINGGIGVLNGILSPLFLAGGIPLFLLLFQLLKTSQPKPNEEDSTAHSKSTEDI